MSDSIRVLVLTGSFLPVAGGLQYELKWFLDNLDRRLDTLRRFSFHFAYPNYQNEPFARFKNIGAYDLQLHDRRRTRIGRMLLRLNFLLRRIRPHVVHCHTLTPEGLWVVLASRLMRKVPRVVVTSHGSDIVMLPEWSYGKMDSTLSKLKVAQTVKRVTAHILPSHAMVEFAIRKGSDKSKLHVIPNGIPLGDEFDFESTGCREINSPLGDIALSDSGADKGFNFLSLSSGRAVKNLGALVDAFALAKDRLGPSRLLLTCQGSGTSAIRARVEDLKLASDVSFLGEVTGRRKQLYFRESDVYCNVSHFESFGITLLEAMKLGTAVLASNVGGIPEFIKHERNGLLVSPTDVEGIAEAMVRLHEDASLRESLVKQAYEDVKQYSMSRVIDEHLALYERVASQSS